MTARLEREVKAGVPVLVCSRCGWWRTCPDESAQEIAARIEKYVCPDCKGPLDAVEPRK